MAVSKVILNGTTLIDITDTTAEAEDVLSPEVFYRANGSRTIGSYSGGVAPTPTPVVQDAGVTFYDYDGTVVQTYTPTEFAALSAMPANPTHTGLTAQGWNWSLADAKAHVAKYGSLNIGQMYTTSDGKTRLYIYIDPSTPSSRMTFYVRFTSSVANNVTIDWGDGTTETNGATTATNYPHTYATTGNFVITLTVNSGTISFVGTSVYSIYGSRDSSYSYNRGRIRKVEIGDNVTSIGSYTFQNCYSLTSINIPDGVTSIGGNAFQNCFSLTSISIPDGVTSIGVYAFSGCYSLTSINIPDGVTSIGSYTFQNCYSLTSITIPDNVTSIGNYVFTACYSLTSINIPDNVTNIGNYAFQSCSSLTSINIPDGVTIIGISTFQNCYSLTSISIPDGVTSIGGNAFSGCYSLTSINIPDGVTSIGGNAFSGCYSLTSINIPDGVTSIGGNAFQNCFSLTSISIPDGVTSIGVYAFSGCYSLTSISIPDGVTSIGGNAFQNCNSLTSISIPDGVTSIGLTVFQYCFSLTSISIPDGVTSIGNNAFSSCYGIGEYHFKPTTPPTLGGTGVFTYIASDCVIYVPYSADHSILEAYQTATNWATHADKMVEEAPT